MGNYETETEWRNPKEGSNNDKAKQIRSLQKLPNQNRRKKQHSFMSMELEDELEAEVKEMGLGNDPTGRTSRRHNSHT